jgi:hypothetical protein
MAAVQVCSPELRVKQQQLRFKDGKGKCSY